MNETLINGSECSSEFDLLAYVYGKMGPAARDTVDSHLEMCGVCVEELAALSQSRFPVYEWKRTEFDAAATPRVMIPYNEAAVSWVESVRRMFALRPALAAAGIIATVTAIGMWAMFTSPLSGTDEVVRADTPASAQVKAAEPAPSPAPAERASMGEPVKPTAVISVQDQPEVVKRKSATRKGRPQRSARPPVVQEVPVLIQADEDVDDSLRLSDIFDEVDTSS